MTAGTDCRLNAGGAVVRSRIERTDRGGGQASAVVSTPRPDCCSDSIVAVRPRFRPRQRRSGLFSPRLRPSRHPAAQTGAEAPHLTSDWWSAVLVGSTGSFPVLTGSRLLVLSGVVAGAFLWVLHPYLQRHRPGSVLLLDELGFAYELLERCDLIAGCSRPSLVRSQSGRARERSRHGSRVRFAVWRFVGRSFWRSLPAISRARGRTAPAPLEAREAFLFGSGARADRDSHRWS